MKSDKRKFYATVGLIWAACAILLFFAYMLVLRPQGQQKRTAAMQLAEQKKAYDIAVAAAEEENQARLTGQVTGLQETLQKFVVDFENAANLTFDISETASRRQIGSFSIESQEKHSTLATPAYNCIGENYFEVRFVAGFHQFAAFLNALERREPAILVDKFMITRSDDPELDHTATLKLAVLVNKQETN
ncbi:MAG: hypothetical protein JW720_14040 [Sedimentisphaerales bacterium]|nr:hypothetical protein [Sedimentisphaerales bacterium]